MTAIGKLYWRTLLSSLRITVEVSQWLPLSCIHCVVDSNPYQLSCSGSSVGRELAYTAECRGFQSHPGQIKGWCSCFVCYLSLFVDTCLFA